jgi:hypothetical protein
LSSGNVNNATILDIPHVNKRAITKTVAQGRLKCTVGVIVSLGQEPPIVVVRRAKMAGQLDQAPHIKPRIGRRDIGERHKGRRFKSTNVWATTTTNPVDDKGPNTGAIFVRIIITSDNKNIVEELHPRVLEEDNMFGAQLVNVKVDQRRPSGGRHAAGVLTATFTCESSLRFDWKCVST